VKLYRAGAIAGLLASAVMLAACSSSKSDDNGGGGGGSATGCAKGTLNGEGSTAQTNAITQWITDFQKKCDGATVNYNATGSGAGVTAFNGNQVDFAGSDSALKVDKGEVTSATSRCGSTPLDLPMVVGPIAVAYKVAGLDSVTLTPELIAKIFTGKITKWNDAAIAAANSGVTLPATGIHVFFRSDSSGTTENFEKYLAATAPDVFTATPDKDSSKAGFVGEGKPKSQGVAQAISATDGAIGYVEYSFAVQNNLGVAKVDNGGGAVELSKDSASAAAGAATVVGTGNDLSLKIDYTTKAAGAYPIILVTYEIVCTKYSDAAKGALVKAFLNYASGAGQDSLAQLGYAPIPADLLTKVKASVATIS